MIQITQYNNYTASIAAALGINHLLTANDDHVSQRIRDNVGATLVAIIPSDDSSGSADVDNITEYSTSYLFIVEPFKADTDTVQFFTRIQTLAERAKKLLLMFAEAYPDQLGIQENRITADPVQGEFSGNYAGYVLGFSLSNPATFFSEDVPLPDLGQIHVEDVQGLPEELAEINGRMARAESDIAGKAPTQHHHTTSDINNLNEILAPLQEDVADIDARVTQAESEIAGKAPADHRHATSDIDNLTEILTPLQEDVADIDERVTQAETDIADKAPADHRHATSDIDSLVETIESLLINEIPNVTSGEKVVTKSTTGINVNKDMIDMQIATGTIASANWSTGKATYPGQQGQVTYDNNYKYECIGTNLWIRTSVVQAVMDLYLADIDDSGGAKTSAELNTAYSTAQIGQRVWGSQFMYEKKNSTDWKKITAVIA